MKETLLNLQHIPKVYLLNVDESFLVMTDCFENLGEGASVIREWDATSL